MDLGAVESTINKWFDDTVRATEGLFKKDNVVDGVAQAALLAARDYCQAILLLLKTNHLMPARALLRTMAELAVKLLWCTVTRPGEGNAEERKRIGRWIYDEQSKMLKVLKRLQEGLRDTDAPVWLAERIKTVEDQVEDCRKNGANECLPKFWELCKELDDLGETGNLWGAWFRFLLYEPYHSAIHLDPKSLSSYIGGSPQTEGVAVDKACETCLRLAYNLNRQIRMGYDVGWQEMDSEFNRLLNNS